MKLMMCLGLVGLLAGCDQSKEELESTRSQLTSMTKERDGLKSQLSSLQQQLTSAKSDLEKAKGAAIAPAATPTVTASAKTKHTH